MIAQTKCRVDDVEVSGAHDYRDPPVPQSCRVLLVEDNQSDVLLVKRMLRQVQNSMPTSYVDVPRMVDALALLDTHAFDLIISDLNILDSDGLATLAALHSMAPDTPLMVLSGQSDPLIRQETMFFGVHYYLVKGDQNLSQLTRLMTDVLMNMTCLNNGGGDVACGE